MPTIPSNNLKERMQKLGYPTINLKITPPILDNSKVIHDQPKSSIQKYNSQTTNINYNQYPPATSSGFSSANNFQEYKIKEEEFKPPVILNIDEWSDFEDDM